MEEKDIHTRANPRDYGYYGYYGLMHSYVHDPGYSTTRTTVCLETNVYDVKTEKLIWSGQAKTWNKNSVNKIINDVIKLSEGSRRKSDSFE